MLTLFWHTSGSLATTSQVVDEGYWIVSGPTLPSDVVLSGGRIWFTASGARGQVTPWDSSMVLRFLAAVEAATVAAASELRFSSPAAQEKYIEHDKRLKALGDALNAQFLSC